MVRGCATPVFPVNCLYLYIRRPDYSSRVVRASKIVNAMRAICRLSLAQPGNPVYRDVRFGIAGFRAYGDIAIEKVLKNHYLTPVNEMGVEMRKYSFIAIWFLSALLVACMDSPEKELVLPHQGSKVSRQSIENLATSKQSLTVFRDRLGELSSIALLKCSNAPGDYSVQLNNGIIVVGILGEINEAIRLIETIEALSNFVAYNQDVPLDKLSLEYVLMTSVNDGWSDLRVLIKEIKSHQSQIDINTVSRSENVSMLDEINKTVTQLGAIEKNVNELLNRFLEVSGKYGSLN